MARFRDRRGNGEYLDARRRVRAMVADGSIAEFLSQCGDTADVFTIIALCENGDVQWTPSWQCFQRLIDEGGLSTVYKTRLFSACIRSVLPDMSAEDFVAVLMWAPDIRVRQGFGGLVFPHNADPLLRDFKVFTQAFLDASPGCSREMLAATLRPVVAAHMDGDERDPALQHRLGRAFDAMAQCEFEGIDEQCMGFIYYMYFDCRVWCGRGISEAGGELLRVQAMDEYIRVYSFEWSLPRGDEFMRTFRLFMQHVRLECALRPYVWVIKERACRRLDAPGTGARFIRDHADASMRM